MSLAAVATPALVIDGGAQAAGHRMRHPGGSRADGGGPCRADAHAKTRKSSAIARLQMLTAPVADAAKMARIARLNRDADLIVAVADEEARGPTGLLASSAA